ncbi:hypothetical protein O181_061824 [Austropuccinia psidii MF-1]|uniref:Uncharacterized protein n=1 Tax=Austropuccinia psidii MF-1 TaxID=1389203 RepID=A0A9Q3EJ80_9BASI|nr:hypothetical protein [Austropuccinia psidii MF-1]
MADVTNCRVDLTPRLLFKMNFPNFNQPVAGGSSGKDEYKEMQNAISQRDEIIARLMQQAEDEAEAKNNPWGSSSHAKKDKGKGRRISPPGHRFQTTIPKRNPTPMGQQKTKHTPKQPPATLVKRNPMQMVMRDAPPDFKYTKEALYVHVKLLWGMLTPAAMPTAPDKLLLKEFYQ